MGDALPGGLYELVLTESLRERLESVSDVFAELGALEGSSPTTRSLT